MTLDPSQLPQMPEIRLSDFEIRLEQACQTIEDADHGERNGVLNENAFAIGLLLVRTSNLLRESEARHRLEEAAVAVCPDEPHKAKDTIERALKAGIQKARGPATNPAPLARPKFGFTLYDDIELAQRKTWLVRDFLGAGEMSCMFGPPGSGKSVLATDLAAHVAAGREWFGRRVTQGGVLYVALERAALVKRRLAAFRKHHGVEEIPLAVLSGQIDLRSSLEGVDVVLSHVEQLKTVTGVPTGLIVVDTVSRALAGGDENSPKDMGALVGNLARIQEGTGAHVSALHHIPVDGTQRLRGHGSLLGAVDTTAGVQSNGRFRTATVDKVNDGPEGESVTFELLSVDLHHDPETDTTTTAPVVVAATAAAPQGPAGGKLTPNQRSMLNILDDAMPQGLTVDEWNEKAREHGIGVTRRATLMDLKKQLQDKRLTHSFGERWFVT